MEGANTNSEAKSNTAVGQTIASMPISKAKKMPNKLLSAMIILTVLMLAGVGFGVYGMLSSSPKVADLEQKITEQEQTIAKLRGEFTSRLDEGEQKLDVPDSNQGGLAQKLLISSLDQFVNWDNSPFIYELRSDFGEFSVHLERQVGGTVEGPEGDISIPTKLHGRIDRNQFNNLEKTEEFEITGIDANRVVDVFVGGFGNGMGDETMLFLMEDGAVEYMPIMKAYEEKDYHSYGRIPGVESVIKFMYGDYCHIPYGPSRGVFAQRADGKFYSLGEVLRKTGNY